MGGWVFDTTGGYGMMYVVCFGLGLFAFLTAITFRPFGQGGIEDHGVWFGDQHPGRVAVAIADDLSAHRIRRLFGIPHGFQRRAVQQCAIVEM